jgi:hypothetical protein
VTRYAESLYEARTIDNGRYFLFGVECPTDIMAAFERMHARVRPQDNGDILLAWIVTTVLVKGDTSFGERVMRQLEALGWQRPGSA